jgi:hypothetical protein
MLQAATMKEQMPRSVFFRPVAQDLDAPLAVSSSALVLCVELRCLTLGFQQVTTAHSLTSLLATVSLVR